MCKRKTTSSPFIAFGFSGLSVFFVCFIIWSATRATDALAGIGLLALLAGLCSFLIAFIQTLIHSVKRSRAESRSASQLREDPISYAPRMSNTSNGKTPVDANPSGNSGAARNPQMASIRPRKKIYPLVIASFVCFTILGVFYQLWPQATSNIFLEFVVLLVFFAGAASFALAMLRAMIRFVGYLLSHIQKKQSTWTPACPKLDNFETAVFGNNNNTVDSYDVKVNESHRAESVWRSRQTDWNFSGATDHGTSESHLPESSLVLHVLGTGSRGNSSVIEFPEGLFLVDCGFSCKQICLRMKTLGLDPQDIRAIFITHEHSDHIKGLEVLRKSVDAPIYASYGTKTSGKSCLASANILTAGHSIQIDRVTIRSRRKPWCMKDRGSTIACPRMSVPPRSD